MLCPRSSISLFEINGSKAKNTIVETTHNLKINYFPLQMSYAPKFTNIFFLKFLFDIIYIPKILIHSVARFEHFIKRDTNFCNFALTVRETPEDL